MMHWLSPQEDGRVVEVTLALPLQDLRDYPRVIGWASLLIPGHHCSSLLTTAPHCSSLVTTALLAAPPPRYLAALRAVPPGERRAWPEGDTLGAGARGARGDLGGDMLPRRLDMDTSF